MKQIKPHSNQKRRPVSPWNTYRRENDKVERKLKHLKLLRGHVGQKVLVRAGIGFVRKRTTSNTTCTTTTTTVATTFEQDLLPVETVWIIEVAKLNFCCRMCWTIRSELIIGLIIRVGKICELEVQSSSICSFRVSIGCLLKRCTTEIEGRFSFVDRIDKYVHLKLIERRKFTFKGNSVGQVIESKFMADSWFWWNLIIFYVLCVC